MSQGSPTFGPDDVIRGISIAGTLRAHVEPIRKIADSRVSGAAPGQGSND